MLQFCDQPHSLLLACLFFGGTSSWTAAGAFNRTAKRADAGIRSLYACEYNTAMLVINAVLQRARGGWWCWSCMIYVAGATASHTQAECVPTSYLYVWVRTLNSHLFTGEGEVTDRPAATGVCLLMADVLIWWRAKVAHMFLSSSLMSTVHAATSGDSIVLLCNAALYLQSTSGVLGWSVLLFCFMYVEDVWHIRTC